MKKWLSAIVLVVMLSQALPLSALAAIGHELTGEELAAAYTLTGLSLEAVGLRSNAVYHKGMRPNATWNAMQVSDWLEDVLSTHLFNVEDMLSRASVAMARLKESNPAAYKRLSGSEPRYHTVFNNLREMYREAEALREEMRYYRDSLQERAALITEMGRQLTEQGGGMFASERVRLSAKIETAAAELDSLRKEVAGNAEGWTNTIDEWTGRLDVLSRGASQEYPSWFEELYSYDGGGVRSTASVVAVDASNSRLGKLSSGKSPLASNDKNADTFVLSENQIAIEMYTGEGGKTPVEGVDVTISDVRDPFSSITRTTDKDGRIILQSDLFIADDHKKVLLRLEVDGEAKGYRSFCIENCRIRMGQKFKGILVPMKDDKPYIYSASFHGYDILCQDFNMLYSHLNDYDFEIKVQTKNPGNNDLTPAPKFGYWKKDESETKGWAHISSWNYKKHLVDADSHEGNTYVFKGPWKKDLTPWVGKEQKPYFTFDSDDPKDMRIESRLISIKSAVDKPLEDGTLAFVNVMGKGLSVKFKIKCPNGDLDFKIDIPIGAYYPMFTVDPGGFVTIVVGAPMTVDRINNSKLNWQNEELESLKDNEKANEKDGFLANYLAKEGVAYKYYTCNRTTFLRESKLELGAFVIFSARWALDNQVEDVKQRVISGRGGMGVILKYSYSWTVRWVLFGMPMYLTLMLSIKAGCEFSHELAFSWINGQFQNWSFKPFKDITIVFGISFTATLGFGIKGFLEGWLRFAAGIEIRLYLALLSQEKSMLSGYGYVNATLGVTVFFATMSVTFWETGGNLFGPIPLGNAAPPLQQYALANAEPEEQRAATQEPMSYPDLVPTAQKVQLNGSDPRARTRVAVIGGQTYLFHLARIKGKDKKERMRLCWVNASDNSKKGSTQTAIDAWSSGLNGRQDYAFDVFVADGYVFACVACAAEFDKNGNPKPNANISDSVKCNQIFYLLMLRPDGKQNLTATLNKGYYLTGIPGEIEGDPNPPKKELVDHVLVTGEPVGLYRESWDQSHSPKTVRYYYDSIDNPEITWARAFTEKGVSTCLGIEFFGTFGRVMYAGEEAPGGITSFELIRGKEGVRCFTDEFVESGMGKGYVRTEVRGAMRCSNTEPKVHDSGVDPRYSPSLLALGRPEDGGEGDRSIEMFDFEMNGVYYGGRKTVVLEKGAIEHFELAQTAVDGDGTNVRRMVFYTEKETSNDGAEQSRLHGLYIEPIQREARNLTFDVTRYDYDLTVPTGGQFSLAYIGDVPYLYWMTTAPREDEDGPDVFRIMASAYDMATNTMTDPAVYAEFSLPAYKYVRTFFDRLIPTRYSVPLNLAPQHLILTGAGTAYLSTVADTSAIREMIEKKEAPEALMPATPPVQLYSFPVQMKPILELRDLFFEDTTVCAGEFEDVNISLMNAGNMGVASYDLEMYTLEGGKTKVWNTIHADCLHPERSTLTMAGNKEAEKLPDNTPVIYRANDFDYTARQRDWVLDQVKRQFHVTVGSSVEVTSVDEVDSLTQFVQTDMLMPGALASFTGALKIPEGWSGDVTLYLRVSKLTTYSNWVGAMANAAGARGNGITANAALPEELTWELDASAGKLMLRTSKLDPNGIAANAIRSGVIANAVDAPGDIALMVADQDIEVDSRVYGDGQGNDMVDIIISNYAATRDSFKLTCAVYLDQEAPYYVNLPYYANGLADRRTHTITMPVSALVPENDGHYQARVVISAVDRQESALANNAFTVYLDGDGLHIVEQPQSQSVQAGEDVAFEVKAAGGGKPYGYQWQAWDGKHQKWVDLPGFTGPRLSREDVEKKWDGVKFRCVVTDANGNQVVTDEVTLTVRDRVPTGDNSNLPLYLAVAAIALILLWILRKGLRRA